MIPALTMLALRHFKHEEPEAELEPKHPTVKFLLAAWNEGDFSDAEKYVASDCAIHWNGFTYDPDEDIDGPTMAKQSVSDWRRIAPDIRMTLLQELREKDRIAIEWLVAGTHTGETPELPASGQALELQGTTLLTLDDNKIVEVSTFFDALSLAVQTSAAEPPAWWPGRGSP